jgi:hypothetical protein
MQKLLPDMPAEMSAIWKLVCDMLKLERDMLK